VTKGLPNNRHWHCENGSVPSEKAERADEPELDGMSCLIEKKLRLNMTDE